MSASATLPIPVKGYAAYDNTNPLKPYEYSMDNLETQDVVVKVLCCGVCASDIDSIDNQFGWTQYPFIPGHEVIGEVVAFGDGVSHLEIGQRVGIGPYRSSCMNCHECNSGLEQLCEDALMTLQPGENGGFADHISIKSEWVIPIPDKLDPLAAAPLMCAGVTAFTPLRLYTTPYMKVGVVGIGGLGHLSVQFAAAMGCEVTAFAADPSEEDVESFKKLGATHVVNFANRDELRAAKSSQDFIFSTIYGGDVGLKHFVRVLRPMGRLVVVGAAMQPMDFPAPHLIIGQKAIQGSSSGGREHTREMLEFATRHGIKPIIEVMKMSECNQAIERVKKGQARFRIVLENDIDW